MFEDQTKNYTFFKLEGPANVNERGKTDLIVPTSNQTITLICKKVTRNHDEIAKLGFVSGNEEEMIGVKSCYLNFSHCVD